MVLRPSILPSLLRVQAHNRDNGVRGLDLFEQAPVFSLVRGEHREQPQVAMVMDLEGLEAGLRPLRGVIERLVEIVLGPDVAVEVTPDEAAAWFAPGARVRAGGDLFGRLGLIEATLRRRLGFEGPVAAAELAGRSAAGARASRCVCASARLTARSPTRRWTGRRGRSSAR